MLVVLLFFLLELGTLVGRPPAATAPLPSRAAVHRLEWRAPARTEDHKVPAKAGGHLDPVLLRVWRVLPKLGG